MSATVLAIAASLAGLAYLTGTDPKRRRAFRMPPATAAHPRMGWAVVLAPGLFVASVAGGGGFTVWTGAVSVLGWAIAALPPERTAWFGQRYAALVDRASFVRTTRRNGRWPDGRITALEARIRDLEARLEILESASALSGKKLARPRGSIDAIRSA